MQPAHDSVRFARPTSGRFLTGGGSQAAESRYLRWLVVGSINLLRPLRLLALVIVMGYPDESPVTEAASGSVDIRVNDKGVRHVPKRKLADIIHHNKFA